MRIASGRISSGREALLDHRRTLRRRVALILALCAAGALAFLADLTTGPSGLGVRDTLAALFHAQEVSRTAEVIVWQVRLPMSAMALLVGAALALAGAEMQTILGNPLAEPFTLGVSYCAALGAAVAIVLGVALPLVPPAWTVSASAFVFALASLGAIHALARTGRPWSCSASRSASPPGRCCRSCNS
ncbi:ABC-type Fe3+-siderophore transport system permease subunit [Azospirillum soli]|nr:iron chelate uptake ABC transporter family permease subunit [Azospirillum soli]MBP2314834.1 ABC-type Fe3+-siderophore transport system permease subunit [Azospirillum soli]